MKDFPERRGRGGARGHRAVGRTAAAEAAAAAWSRRCAVEAGIPADGTAAYDAGEGRGAE